MLLQQLTAELTDTHCTGQRTVIPDLPQHGMVMGLDPLRRKTGSGDFFSSGISMRALRSVGTAQINTVLEDIFAVSEGPTLGSTLTPWTYEYRCTPEPMLLKYISKRYSGK